LIRVSEALASEHDEVLDEVLRPALLEPVMMLFSNCGISAEDAKITIEALRSDPDKVYDLLDQKTIDAKTGGLLDSLPAVLEAVRNSLSIASLLGTLGGIIVFSRDTELERSEAKETRSFLRDANDVSSYVDDRAM
jgi:chaperonin GroEL (HSP60 family)